MTNFPFKDPITVKHVGLDDLATLLRAFEDAWSDAHGERISSEVFYARYGAGEVDSNYAAAWATYYEAALELKRRRDIHVESLPGSLLGAS